MQSRLVITSLPVLVYFDSNKEPIIQCDASKKGLGAVLLQEGQLVVYILRTLTETEQRYSSIEWELLAVVFALERLNCYTYGFRTKVQTDQEPLTSIWKKPVSSTSARVQRLLLRLLKYDIDLQYLPRKKNVIADARSRVSPLAPKDTDVKSINCIASNELTINIPATTTRTTRVPRLHSERQHPDKTSRVCTQRLAKWSKRLSQWSLRILDIQRVHLSWEWTTIQRGLTNTTVWMRRDLRVAALWALWHTPHKRMSKGDCILAKN